MRRITVELRQVKSSVAEYEKGRLAFVQGASFTELPASGFSLIRAGWLDALADTVTALAKDGAIHDISIFAPAPSGEKAQVPWPEYKPLDHGPRRTEDGDQGESGKV